MTIGSSDIGVLLGGQWAAPYADTSPWSVLRRCQGKPLPQRDTSAQSLGRDFELLLLAWLGVQLKLMGRPGPQLEEPPLVVIPGVAHARPDGILWDRRGDVAAEVKVVKTFGREWGPPGTDEVAPYCRPQCWWHMVGARVPTCYLVALARDSAERRIYRLDREREQPLIDVALDFAKAWHDKHVVRGEPLSFDGTIHARRQLDELHPPRPGVKRPDAYPTAYTAELYRLASEASAAKKRAADAYTAACDALRMALGPAGRLLNSRGKVLVNYGDARPRPHVDLEALRLEAPDLVRKHTTMREPESSRIVRVYPGKETT